MMNEVKQCPKCNRLMELGKLLGDFQRGIRLVGESDQGKKVRESLEESDSGPPWIMAYVCPRCGYIELYLARSKTKTKM